MSKKFYVTTAIAYPNSSPHLGHALEIIQADVVARFNRLLGKDVFFQTGTDEHGTKNWKTAEKEGKEIKTFLDENVAVFKKLYKELNISYDYFIRTTDKKVHHPGAIKLWKALVAAGDIYKKNYSGLYCAGCEAFKTERELEKGKCPNHPTRTIETVEEENYFFRLSKYSQAVAQDIAADTYHVVPETRKNEILSFLRTAKDISFSRPKASLPWGIPVPDDPEHVMYVWCDALSNYITGVGYGRDEKQFPKIWPADVHIIGKDILRFHAAFWPAMLLSAHVPLPKQLFVHGFILSRGAKMSKSTGNVIEPFDQIKKYGVDPFRFYILGAMPIDADGEYSEELVVERINTELIGNLSNFCYRVLSFANAHYDSTIKDVADDPLIGEITARFAEVKKAYEAFDFRKAIELILSISSLGNKYFQDNEPWEVIKHDKERVHRIVGLCVNLVKNLSILIQPIAPSFSAQIQKQLNLNKLTWDDLNFEMKNHTLGTAEIVLRKQEGETMSEEGKELFPLDLRVAQIEKVEDHPDADKLIVMHVDLGSEKRQVVAGLKTHYSKEALEGKKIVVVANLERAKLRGVESQAMLLAGCTEDESVIDVLTVKKSKPGDAVHFEGLENSTGEISFKNFQKLDMRVKGGAVYCDGKVLKTDSENVIAENAPDGAKVR